MKNICVDACFLIALYDPQEGATHQLATTLFEQLFASGSSPHRMIVPWPILYETVSTRMTRRRPSMEYLRRDWLRLRGQNQLQLLFDKKLRQQALEQSFAEVERDEGGYRALSLVDRVVRLMLLNRRLRLHAFVTFNRGDFDDVCRQRNIALIDDVLA